MAYTKKAQGPPRKPKPPRMPADHPPVDLLRKAGATEAVIAEVYREWNGLDYQERLDAAEDLRAMTPEEMAAAVLVTETMLASGMEVGDEEVGEVSRLLPEALKVVPASTVAEAEAWADEHGRAGLVAALVAEVRRPPDDRRKTLVEGLRGRLRG